MFLHSPPLGTQVLEFLVVEHQSTGTHDVTKRLVGPDQLLTTPLAMKDVHAVNIIYVAVTPICFLCFSGFSGFVIC